MTESNDLLPFQKAMKKPPVHLRGHDTEPEEFVVQERKGGAVPNHQAQTDGFVKQVAGGKGFIQNPNQHKVGGGGIHLVPHIGV